MTGPLPRMPACCCCCGQDGRCPAAMRCAMHCTCERKGAREAPLPQIACRELSQQLEGAPISLPELQRLIRQSE